MPPKCRPTFMIAAASVCRSRSASTSGDSVPGQHVSTSSPSTSGVPIAADAALTDVTPGTMCVVEAVGEPLVHVHVRAEEQRVALGEQHDVAAGVEVRGQPLGGLGVEVGDRAGVAARVVGGLGGHRVDELLLDLPVAQVRLGDRRARSSGRAARSGRRSRRPRRSAGPP